MTAATPCIERVRFDFPEPYKTYSYLPAKRKVKFLLNLVKFAPIYIGDEYTGRPDGKTSKKADPFFYGR